MCPEILTFGKASTRKSAPRAPTLSAKHSDSAVLVSSAFETTMQPFVLFLGSTQRREPAATSLSHRANDCLHRRGSTLGFESCDQMGNLIFGFAGPVTRRN